MVGTLILGTLFSSAKTSDAQNSRNFIIPTNKADIKETQTTFIVISSVAKTADKKAMPNARPQSIECLIISVRFIVKSPPQLHYFQRIVMPILFYHELSGIFLRPVG